MRSRSHLEQVNATLKKQEAVQRISTDTDYSCRGSVHDIIQRSFGIERGDKHRKCNYLYHRHDEFIWTDSGIVCAFKQPESDACKWKSCIDLLAEEPVVMVVESNVEVPDEDIRISNVTFTYPEDKKEEKPILKNFSLDIRKNTIHGILGRSGCGKSTLLKLLMRFYETDSGSVSYGTRNVNEIDTGHLRNHISYVTQETFLFQDTIENNIKVAKADADKRRGD